MEIIESKEGRIYSWQTCDRHYWITPGNFTKRQLYPSEQQLNIRGEIASIPWSRERLKNEYLALRFISENTTIPVPRILDYVVTGDISILELQTIDGETAEDLFDDLSAEDQETLNHNINSFMDDVVLPQLASLRSRKLGGLCGSVIPHPFIRRVDKRPEWPSKTFPAERYVFCHSDLGRHNVMVDPKTLKVLALIDWEYSGFYPAVFEHPYYLKPLAERREEDQDISHLIALLDEPEISESGDPGYPTGSPQLELSTLVSWMQSRFRSAFSLLLSWMRSGWW